MEVGPLSPQMPWAFFSRADQVRLTTEPHECADCGMDDLPYVAGWRLCAYCHELRELRAGRGNLVDRYADLSLLYRS